MAIRILVLCTVETGLDAVAEVLRNDFDIVCLVGVNPLNADPLSISGYVDIEKFSKKWNLNLVYVNRYDLKDSGDQHLLSSIDFDLIWVAGWQRLIPKWLIECASLGAIGGHGSPDGIEGGRGRSPQNWAIMLGCKRFDLALFKITPGVDEGSIIVRRSFFYTSSDDISTSYKKASLCTAEMIIEILENPILLEQAKPQTGKAFYYPQRKPEDGFADWSLPAYQTLAHCRSLTHPYPGLRTLVDEKKEMVIWKCQLFDDKVNSRSGSIVFIFEDGSFLVQASDARILVTQYEFVDTDQHLSTNNFFTNKCFKSTINEIIARHNLKYSQFPIANRLKFLVSDE